MTGTSGICLLTSFPATGDDRYGRLGFALQLKFRQVQGHYPDSVHDFFIPALYTIAEQVGCAFRIP